MMNIDHLTRDFTQSLIQTVVLTAIGFLPNVIGTLSTDDVTAIAELCQRDANAPLFKANVLQMSVNSLIRNIPTDAEETAASESLYSAALANDEMTGQVVQEVSFKLAQSLRTVFGIMKDCVSVDAHQIVGNVEARLGRHADEVKDVSRRIDVFNWGVLQDESVMFHVLTTCREVADVAIRNDGTPNSDRFIDVCFGRLHNYALEAITGDATASVESLLTQVCPDKTEHDLLRNFMTRPNRFHDYVWGAKEDLVGSNCGDMVRAVQRLSDAYATTINFKRNLTQTPDLMVADDRVYSNLEKMITGLSMALGAVQVLREKYSKTMILTVNTPEVWDDVVVEVNGDAYTPVQEQVQPQSVLNVVKYFHTHKQTVPRMGLTTSKVMDSLETANVWAADQQEIGDRDQSISDTVLMRRQAELELTDWTTRHSQMDSSSALTDTTRLQIEATARKISNGDASMLDVVTGFVVRQYNNPALTQFHNYLMDGLSHQPAELSAVEGKLRVNATTTAKWLVNQINTISATAA